MRRKTGWTTWVLFLQYNLETVRFLYQRVLKCPILFGHFFLKLMFCPYVLVKHQSSKALLPPTVVQVSTVADWPLFLVVSRLAFFFLLLRTMMCLVCMCACVCVRVMLFADLELIPFKNLLNTFEWDWLMFASTIVPSSSLNSKGNPGRQKQSVLTEVSDGIWMLFAPRSVLYIVYDTHFWTHM